MMININELLNQVTALHGEGNFLASEKILNDALMHQPKSTKILNALAATKQKLGRPREALYYMNEILQQHPDNIQILSSMGHLYFDAAGYSEAIDFYARVLSKNQQQQKLSEDEICHIKRRQILAHGRLQQYETALNLSDDFLKAHQKHLKVSDYVENINLIESHIGPKAALEKNTKILKKFKNDGGLLYQSATLKSNLGDFKAAILQYQKGLDKEKNEKMQSNYLSAMGTCYQRLGNFAMAEKCYKRGLKKSPNDANIYWNYGLCLLHMGHFQQGWELYDYRWKTQKYAGFILPWTIPRWRGEDISGKKLLIHCEQGIGDQIFFLSYIKKIASRGAKILLTSDARMENMLARSLPVQVLKGGYLQEHILASEYQADYYLSLGSVCKMAGMNSTRAGTIIPWLKADEGKVAKYKKLLREKFPDGKVLGISWFTRKDSADFNIRNISLNQLLPVLKLQDYHFVSLQYGDISGSLKKLKEQHGIDIFTIPDFDLTNDLDDLIALLKALDGIISTRNNILHFAGALGIPAITLMPAEGEWRWPLGLTHSPHYKSIKIFWQKSPWDWSMTVEDLKQYLQK